MDDPFFKDAYHDCLLKYDRQAQVGGVDLTLRRINGFAPDHREAPAFFDKAPSFRALQGWWARAVRTPLLYGLRWL
jgi:hypothetical protein